MEVWEPRPEVLEGEKPEKEPFLGFFLRRLGHQGGQAFLGEELGVLVQEVGSENPGQGYP